MSNCNNGPILNTANLEVEDTNCETCITNYYKVINTKNCIHKDNPPFAYYLISEFLKGNLNSKFNEIA